MRRDRTPQQRRMYLRRRIVVGTAALLVIALVVIVVNVVSAAIDLATGVHRSSIDGVAQETAETNILVMGLDSRVDENGDALPREVYNAIHAGDQNDGGYNANVLMLIHLPADGGQAVGISIPRDDYVAYSGAPGGRSHGKIKEAYGLAFDQKERELMAKGVGQSDAYQQARAYARQTEIKTVSAFLGGVHVDHFIEVTMAAFYSVARVVQPVTVCLNHATQDAYSGADFPAGVQQISASQAMSFVRQRRDTGPSDFNLTDLDRTRRQQAFIVSLAVKLRKASTFADLGTLRSLIDTAKQYVALDDRFDLLSFAGQAQRLSGGHLQFVTLPIDHFGTRGGEDVNIVDDAAIRAQVRGLLHPAPPPSPTAASGASGSSGGAGGTGASAGGRTSGGSTGAPAQGGGAAAPSGASNTYTDSQTPLTSGAVPCVN